MKTLRDIWYSLAFRVLSLLLVVGGIVLLGWYLWNRWGLGGAVVPVLVGGAALNQIGKKMGMSQVERDGTGRPVRADLGARGEEIVEIKHTNGTVTKYKKKRPLRGGSSGFGGY